MSVPFVSAGVIGWPVAHSKSPLIHRFWLGSLGIDGDYGRFPVAPAHLAAAVRALPALGLAGVNVTVPHKVAVLPLLDRLDATARAAGAVNSIRVEPGGRLLGVNTDVAGITGPLAPLGPFPRVVLLGAGGAARAVVAALPALGARHLVILNRSRAPAESLLAASGLAGAVRPLAGRTPAADLLVNATSLGMVGQPPLPVAIGGRPLVFDLVYAPPETALLAEARALGLAVVDGLEMLVAQAAEAFRLFTGAAPPRARDAELRRLLLAAAAPAAAAPGAGEAQPMG